MRYSSGIAALLMLGLSGPAALAQAPGPAGGDGETGSGDSRRYQVEIIVFENLEGNPGDEDFQHAAGAPLASPALRRLLLPEQTLDSLLDFGRPAPDSFAAAAGAAGSTSGAAADSASGAAAGAGAQAPPVDRFATATAPVDAPPDDGLELIEPFAGAARAGRRPAGFEAAALPPGFRALASRELTLTDVRSRLDNLRAYRVLGHAGWIQNGVDENGAIPVDLRLLGITNPTGSLKLWVGRYFHAVADLVYVRGQGSFWSAPPDAALAPFEYAERIAASPPECPSWRRDVLCYFDHPLLGLIVMVQAAPEPESAAGEPGGPAG